MAIPSPVARSGLLVYRETFPEPPGGGGPLALAAGQVLRGEDPALRVPSLSAEVVLLPPVPAGEPDPPFDQFPDLRGGVAHDQVHDVGPAEAAPRLVGVLDVGFERVLAAPDGGDPPLGVVRAGLGGRPFRDNRYRSLPGRAESETQARDAAPDDQEMGMPFHPFPPARSPCRLTREAAIY